MAYDVSKLTKLGQLKTLAEKVKSEDTKLSSRIDEIVSTGGEPNVITAVKVNGTPLTITDKAVDVKVPGYTVVKDEDAGAFAAVYHFQKDGVNEGVAINIPKDMVVSSGEVVTNPEGHTAGTYLKLVLANAEASEIFIPVDSLIEYVTTGSGADDAIQIAISTDHKVSASIKDGSIGLGKLSTEVQTTLGQVANKVDKVEGKGFSTEDFTTALKTKLEGIQAGATKVAKSSTNGNILVNDSELTVYTEPADVIHGAIATDEEVTEMLTEVFGA